MIRITVARDKVCLRIPEHSDPALLAQILPVVRSLHHDLVGTARDDDPALPPLLFGTESEWHPPMPTPTHRLKDFSSDSRLIGVTTKQCGADWLRTHSGQEVCIEAIAADYASGFFLPSGKPFGGAHIANFDPIEPTSQDQGDRA